VVIKCFLFLGITNKNLLKVSPQDLDGRYIQQYGRNWLRVVRVVIEISIIIIAADVPLIFPHIPKKKVF